MFGCLVFGSTNLGLIVLFNRVRGGKEVRLCSMLEKIEFMNLRLHPCADLMWVWGEN